MMFKSGKSISRRQIKVTIKKLSNGIHFIRSRNCKGFLNSTDEDTYLRNLNKSIQSIDLRKMNVKYTEIFVF